MLGPRNSITECSIMTNLTYASSAWIGFSSANDRQKTHSFYSMQQTHWLLFKSLVSENWNIETIRW